MDGIMDNLELIDSLIVDCNTLVKSGMSGQYVEFCAMIVQMVQKLGNLKEGVKTDMKALQDMIDELKKRLGDECRNVDN